MKMEICYRRVLISLNDMFRGFFYLNIKPDFYKNISKKIIFAY